VIALNERVTHYRRVAEADADRRKRSGKRAEVVQSNEQNERGKTVSLDNLNRANAVRKVNREQALNGLIEHFERNPNASYSEVGQSVGRSKSWVAGAVADLEDAGRILRDNGKVKVLV